MTDEFTKEPADKISLLKRSLIFGVGINDSNYKVSILVEGKRVQCPIYSRWAGMIKRCYSEKFQIKNPCYLGSSVCKHWIVFSNFKSWMEEQDWEGKDLDKDIISPGNKLYSPENCRFITNRLNKLLTSCAASRGKYPQGVHFNRSRENFSASFSSDTGRVHIGCFSTPELASAAYIKEKCALIRRVASEQSDEAIKRGLIMHAEDLESASSGRSSEITKQR